METREKTIDLNQIGNTYFTNVRENAGKDGLNVSVTSDSSSSGTEIEDNSPQIKQKFKNKKELVQKYHNDLDQFNACWG